MRKIIIPAKRAGISLFLLMIIATEIWAKVAEESLNRGLVAFGNTEGEVYVSWRLLAKDPVDITFNVYKINGEKKVKLNRNPISVTTDYLDVSGGGTGKVAYLLESIVGKRIIDTQLVWVDMDQRVPYKEIKLNQPKAVLLEGNAVTYQANDASVADLDGDGQYEIILKWEPSNAKNPPQLGLTAPTLIDAYTLEGVFLWRIDLGINIRSGAAYNPFLVYDFDGDGKAELICKTADNTRDGLLMAIGDTTKDWRNHDPNSNVYGKVLEGSEYLTVFEGISGKAIHTVAYYPDRYPLDGWGGIGGNGGNDNLGSRSDRFTACVAYLNEQHPSAVMIRGWYGRTVLTAWDYDGKRLLQRWVFDSENASNPYSGQANHSVVVADVDGDGLDEICVGAMTVDHDGKGLYTTGLRHGDALHIGDFDLDNEGLEVFGIHESEGRTLALKTPGVALFDAATGSVLWQKFEGVDVGRGVSADIDPRYPGSENWGGPGGLRDAKGREISKIAPRSTNFLVWWDADLQRELLNDIHIEKWNGQMERTDTLFVADGCKSNNGTKATPSLSADLYGDWREEVIWPTKDNQFLRIYSTQIPAIDRRVTLMQNRMYRLAVAWQNVAYNQPPNVSYNLADYEK